MKKTLGIIISLIILAVGIYFIVTRIQQTDREPSAMDTFAQCVTDAGATYYGAFWCPNCQAQKQLFGKSQKYITYVECSTPSRQQKEICTEAGITGYPTWEFADGERLSGVQSLVTLADKTSCALPQE